ncbi:MAG: gamma-glutamyl-gamma-aminobutyrate hydrolase family protein [Nitratireductor sp.]
MKIGILQTGIVPDQLADKHGQYDLMFSRLLSGHGFEFENFAVVNNVFPKDVHDCDGWLVTGSRHGAYEPHPWIPPLEEFIRNAYAAGIPMVGICFGHQIMAQALGGKVEKFSGGWGVGPNSYVTADGKRIDLHAMHQDQVVVLPPEARVTASSEFCRNAALAYNGKAISYQPHPEFSPDYMRDLIEIRKGSVLPEKQADQALNALSGELDSPVVANEIAEFFKSGGKGKSA